MKRSKFNLSNTKLLSMDQGELIPIGLTEVLPGDSIQQATTCLIRFSPLLAPVMHQVNAYISHWFVPHRLVWDGWEDFITGGADGMDVQTIPQITNGTVAVGDLGDYYGLPPGLDMTVAERRPSRLPFVGYNLIWNEWYRDQDLQAEAGLTQSSYGAYVVRRVAWEKDYFTSARPWEQKGPSITIPLGSTAPVLGLGVQDVDPAAGPTPTIRKSGVTAVGTYGAHYAQEANPANAGQNIFIEATGTGASGRPNLRADLSGASAISINILREAFALQRFEEARARFGSRYVEYLRYLGVRSSDARLQRPEYLGGGRYPVQFSEVLQTAEGENPVGELRGHGIGAARSARFRRFFEEHGYIHTLLTVKPKTIYASGIHRTFTRRTKEDFFQKELQHIGQQEVWNKEVRGMHTTPNGVFGYQDRYDEYRRAESSIAGEFRTTLDFWHFARQFSTDPALNASFVECTPTEEPFAVPSADVLYVMARHSIQARRIVASSGNSFIY